MVRLLQLPDKILRNVLKRFTIMDLILFSLCSKRTKRLVKSVNRKVRCIGLDLRHGVDISVNLLSQSVFFEISQTDDEDLGKLVPCKLTGYKKTAPVELNNPKFGVRDWIDHFLFIFKYDNFHLGIGRLDNFKYTLESVRDVLKGLTIGSMLVIEPNEEIADVLRLFPVTNYLNIHSPIGQPEGEISKEAVQGVQRALIGNMAFVHLEPTIPLRLDLLLSMNSKEIRSENPKLSDKDLNTFLKLWLRGSNPRLEQLELYFLLGQVPLRILNKEAILKGIDYEKKLDEKMIGGTYLYLLRRFQLSGGSCKSDGALATIGISPGRMRMHVSPL